jgi:alkane 1-monooxygenase
MAWVPAQAALLIWACWAVSVWDLPRAEFIGFFGSVGLCTGVLGINIAHELIHKSNATEQLLGKLLLTSVCYGHFFVEHIFGHHRHVSTPHVSPALVRSQMPYAALSRRTRRPLV